MAVTNSRILIEISWPSAFFFCCRAWNPSATKTVTPVSIYQPQEDMPSHTFVWMECAWSWALMASPIECLSWGVKTHESIQSSNMCGVDEEFSSTVVDFLSSLLHCKLYCSALNWSSFRAFQRIVEKFCILCQGMCNQSVHVWDKVVDTVCTLHQAAGLTHKSLGWTNIKSLMAWHSGWWIQKS